MVYQSPYKNVSFYAIKLKNPYKNVSFDFSGQL